MFSPSKGLALPTEPRIPAIIWWALGIAGFGLRLAFILRGNIAFNGDVAVVSGWIQDLSRTGRIGDKTLADFSSLRIYIGLLFYYLTNGWVYFGSLASVFITSTSSILFVYWIHQNISRLSAFFLAVFLSFPPFCAAYFSTNLERRVDTTFYGALMVLCSGNLLKSPWKLFLFFLLLGWSFWEEPFILFFAAPILLFEFFQKERRSVGSLFFLSMGSGLFLGCILGGTFNQSFDSSLPNGYVHWGLGTWAGICKNFNIFIQVLPQYWSGNFPFGYLQGSDFGLKNFPMDSGWFKILVGIWWVFLSVFSATGYFIFRSAEKESKKRAFLIWGPSLLFVLFFLFSAQTWDALSLRYLSFLMIGVGAGAGMGIEAVLLRRRSLGILLFLAVWGIQVFTLGYKMRELPPEFPAIKIVNVLEKMRFDMVWGSHWIAEPGFYLGQNKLRFLAYEKLFRRVDDLTALEQKRVGLVHLQGLDRPEVFSEVILRLERAGYQYSREWPMLEGWSVLEFQKIPVHKPS